MESFWSFFILHFLVGVLFVAVGYWLHQREKKREEGRRGWVTALAYVMMLAGAIYGLGTGTGPLFSAMMENLK